MGFNSPSSRLQYNATRFTRFAGIGGREEFARYFPLHPPVYPRQLSACLVKRVCRTHAHRAGTLRGTAELSPDNSQRRNPCS
jgi:hypothetical protein